ncbi:peroxiredoxin [Sphingorhabdus lutea]|uniref:thioredoxin-dependent peroxiredoxin n=1 Tax=Sphingorhabdus lutea TaxID=1913578 RepID=A0A1L3J9H8_9SPHN|nr:peroxiredoxin [Sphingorhabdus lutea]APG61770.1 peroxiredoxin [Sphingorhabdus lutea]
MTEIGGKIPSITLLDHLENKVEMANITHPAVIYFYPKADTPGCTKEGQQFTEKFDDFTSLGVNIYGVSKDKPAKLEKFAAKYDFKHHLLSDEESNFTEEMGVWVEKNMYGRKYMGIERATFLTDKSGKIAQIWRKVKVKDHAEAVLEAAKGL